MSEIKQAILRAIVNCPHEIDGSSVTLKYDPRGDGHNALAQFSNRLVAALEAGAAKQAETTETNLKPSPWTDVTSQCAECLKAILRAEAAEAQLAERVKVKQLDWVRCDSSGCSHAKTELGDYIAWDNGRVQFGAFGTSFVDGGSVGARSKAQADYERRARSTFEATPPAPKVTEARLLDAVARAIRNSEFVFGDEKLTFKLLMESAFGEDGQYAANAANIIVPQLAYLAITAAQEARKP